MTSKRLRAVAIPTVLKEANVGNGEPIALKVDIEGSEQELFSGDTLWLRDISCIAIELHDNGHGPCTRTFMNAIEKYLAEPPQKMNDTTFVRLTPNA